MATPQASDVLGHVTLVTGPEELLNQRTVSGAVAAVQAADPESEMSETTADRVSMAVLGDLAAPSLFSSIRCVVVRGLEDLPDDTYEGLLEYAAAPSEDIGLILVHSGGQKGSGLLTKLRKLATVTEVKSASLRPSEFSRFVAAEVRGHGGRIAEDAADLLVQAIGQDLRALAGAAHQLASDFPGEPLTASVVKKYFGGRAEVKSFAIADAALAGRTALALEELRWALDNGTAAVARHQCLRDRAARARPVQLRAPRDAGGRPRPGGRGAAVEAPDPPRAGPRLGRPRPRDGDHRGRAGRRGREGGGRRRGVLPGADGADRHRAAATAR